MSIHTLSAALASQNIDHVVVIAKAGGSIKDIAGLVKTVKSKEGKEFAQDYYDWVSGGRKGTPPEGECDFKTIKYIRAVVSQLV